MDTLLEGEMQKIAKQLSAQISPFVRSVQCIASAANTLLFHIESYYPIDEERLRLALDLHCQTATQLFCDIRAGWSVVTVSGKQTDILFCNTNAAYELSFVESLILGLEETEPEEKIFTAADLGTVLILDKDVLIANYRQWINSVITHRQQRFDDDCVKELRPFWLCCARHRLLKVQRESFNDRIMFYDDENLTKAPLHYRQPVEYEHPSFEGTVALFENYNQKTYQTPEELLADYIDFSSFSKVWQNALPGCNYYYYGTKACCSFHLIVSSAYDLHQHWFNYWCWKYGIPYLSKDNGYPYGVGMSGNSVSLLCIRANVNMKNINWFSSSWHADVVINVERMRSQKLFDMIRNATLDLSALSTAQAEFLHGYAEKAGVSDQEYLRFLDVFFETITPYLDLNDYVRLEDKVVVDKFHAALHTLPFGDAREQAKRNFEALQKTLIAQHNGRIMVVFDPIWLLLEDAYEG